MFSPVSGDPKRIFCNICQCAILKTSKPSHISTRKHSQGLVESGSQTSTSMNAGFITPVQPVLRHPISFADLGSNPLTNSLIDSSDDEAALPDPFSNYLMNNDGTYQTLSGSNIRFTAGVDNDKEQLHDALDQQLEDLEFLRGHTLLGGFDDDNEHDVDDMVHEDGSTVSRLTSALEILDVEDDDDEMMEEEDQEPEKGSAWWPYPDKQSFLIDMMDSQPRQRLSDEHLKLILSVMREAGTPNVPKFTTIRSLQKKLKREFGLKTRHHCSSLGNHFYMNHPRDLFALDWGNPLVRKHMHVYPEVAGPVSETWSAMKWLEETPLEDLSPMWADWKSSEKHRHYYVDELAQTSDGRFVIPIRWVTVCGVVHADIYSVECSADNVLTVLTGSRKRIVATELRRNLLDIQSDARWIHITFSQYSSPHYFEESAIRKVAKGRPMFRLRIIPWSDDVSGNVSKQYNAHTNVYATNATLPHQYLSQEYFIRSCSTSSFASSSEQFVALAEDFHTDQWYDAYDCALEQEILYQIIPHFLPADNPQQSETSSHLGVNANLNCRRDMSGGPDEHKETVEGYEALYTPGDPRTCEQTVQCIRWQLWLACQGNSEAVKESASSSGVKDKIAQGWIEKLLTKSKPILEQRLKNRETRNPQLNSRMTREDRKQLTDEIATEVGQELWKWLVCQPESDYSQLAEDDPLRSDIRPGVHFNVLLRTRGIDPHADTPGEILHTYLLGQDKYVWHCTNKTWTKVQDETFAIRLQSSTTSGLTIPPLRAAYLIQYKNSLIGKHFKSLQQLGVFHVHDLCPPAVFQLWKATGELGAFLWFPEIRNMDEYINDLQVLIANVLDAWGTVDPRRILTKSKLHVLTHLADDIRRFGPAVIFATEVFESFNAVFRLCSILSNHLAPSRDISEDLGDLERFKHVVSGGYWKQGDGLYVCAGPAVIAYFKKDRSLQQHLGWADKSLIKAGLVKRYPRKKMDTSSWITLVGILRVKNATPLPLPSPESRWDRCLLAVSQSGDICKETSWVFYHHREIVRAGRILRIYCMTGAPLLNDNVLVLIESFDIGNERDTRLDMPVLVRAETKEIALIHPNSLLFDFNAQHNCVASGCAIGDSPKRKVQERLETEEFLKCILHTNEDHYHLNMHALHNAHLVRATLPRHLVKPTPIQNNRKQFHRELALELQISGPAKRAATQAKAKDTRERNKGSTVVGLRGPPGGVR